MSIESSPPSSARPRLTKGPNVLSWDCGITNLCYCLVELVVPDAPALLHLDGSKQPPSNEAAPVFRVATWENFSLNSQTLMQATTQLVRELDARPWMLDVDAVCIENQVLKNVQMKVVSHAIQCYFEARCADGAATAAGAARAAAGAAAALVRKERAGPQVNFIMAESKFKAVPGVPIPLRIEALQRRTRNKRAAVFLAQELLARQGHTTALAFLNSFQKKDDLSDAFLQGVYFLKQEAKRDTQRRKVRAYLGLAPRNAAGAFGGGGAATTELTIDVACVTGTKDEPFDDSGKMNEGCEYEREVPLPHLYVSPHFTAPPAFGDLAGSATGVAVKFMRQTPLRARPPPHKDARTQGPA